MPSLPHNDAQEAEVNCAPLSEVRVSGTPNLATQLNRKASPQEAAEMSLRGTASNQREVRSTIVRRYRNPSEEAGKGPTMSTCT
jgi:hypothetical protein